MEKTSFPYAFWAKSFGLLLIAVGIVGFFYKHYQNGVFDFNELAIGLSFGFLFIFFSKEKKEDEMIHHLKFKALTKAVIIAFSITNVYNYIFLNWRFKREHNAILSISAYQFLALTLIIATVIFYYQKYYAVQNKEE